MIICAGGILLLLLLFVFCWGHYTWLIELILVAIFFENVNIWIWNIKAFIPPCDYCRCLQDKHRKQVASATVVFYKMHRYRNQADIITLPVFKVFKWRNCYPALGDSFSRFYSPYLSEIIREMKGYWDFLSLLSHKLRKWIQARSITLMDNFR